MVQVLLCTSLISYAQLSAKREYNIPLASLLKQSPAATELDSGQVFYLKTDTVGLAADTLRLVAVMLQKGDSPAEDYTHKITTDSFSVSKEKILKFRFTLCKKADTASNSNCSSYQEREIIFQRKKTAEPTNVPAINTAITTLKNDPDYNNPIGYFELNTDSVAVMGDTPKIFRKITKVEITLENGSIAKRGLLVTLENGEKFINWTSPISLARFPARMNDQLFAKDPLNKKKHITVTDALRYNYFYKFHYPEDANYALTKDKKTDTIKVGASINQLIEVRVFTDLLGLVGKKANGLIQTEISGNFISNTTSLSNTDITFHCFVKPYFRVSKLDSRFANLDTANITRIPGQKDEVNRVYLNQISYLQAGIKTNIVRFGIGVNQEIFVNTGLDINLVNADSLYQKDISFINYYPEVEYRINRLNNFGLECGGRFYWQFLTKTAPFSNKGAEQILHFYSTINYYPFNNTNSKIYIRFSGFTSVKASDYSFSQFQFGVKTGLFASKPS